ncbi:ATP-binding protein [Paenibacillus sp. WLX1005]|uniref:ATP-binding protein n=1 Tax=Paenibacillus sp. WLX1005 TaxID=3243766 RepID=UPI003983E93E
MESIANEVYFNFSYYALNLLGKQMYTSKWSAISELVANGLDAGADNVRVYINSIVKERSTIEIFDNGSGMSYEDIAKKYALIGRNKREEDDNVSNKIKGRKGVGKLAGLFLSKKYYIVTKTNNLETSWVLDSTNVRDSDVPKLDRVDKNDVEIENEKIWNSYSTGTLIKLTDVDMTNFAGRKLDGLKRRIADYYLLDNLSANIEVAYITKLNEEIIFEVVKKEVAFQNFYALFETIPKLKSDHLKEFIMIRSKKADPDINYYREVLTLHPDDISTSFKIKGEREFINLDGNLIVISMS